MKTNNPAKLRFLAKRKNAFTLMEILLAIALLGVLMGVFAVGFGNIFGTNQIKAAGMFANHSVKPNLMQYRMDMGSYPTTAEGLNALLNPPAGDKASRWKGPYADTISPDPWGNAYQYCSPGVHNKSGYDVWSYGPDGVPSEDDVGNW